MAVTRDIVFVEVEDTILEIYSGTHQIIQLATIAMIHDAGFLLIAPYTKDTAKATIPISFFFRKTSEINLKKKELWLVQVGRDVCVYALKLKNDQWLTIRPNCREHRIELTMDKLKQLWLELNKPC